MGNDGTRINVVSERKNSFRKFDFFSFAVLTNVIQKKRPKTEQKT